MKTYTQLRNLYGKRTKNVSTANLTLGDDTINDEIALLCARKDFAFLHKARTFLTTANTQFKPLPYDIDTVESVSVTIGTKVYTPKLIANREQWDKLNQVQFTSDFPRFAYVYDGQVGLWPTPATSNNTVTVNGKIRPVPLSIADITSTTITTLANGSTALTVSAGLTTQMSGFWIKPTLSTTANTGDGRWYEISGVTNATTGTLVRAYGGVSITAGSAACIIGQVPILPEAFHETPVWKAASDYWFQEGDDRRGLSFARKYEEGVKLLDTQYTAFITDPVLDEGIWGETDIINNNLTVSL